MFYRYLSHIRGRAFFRIYFPPRYQIFNFKLYPSKKVSPFIFESKDILNNVVAEYFSFEDFGKLMKMNNSLGSKLKQNPKVEENCLKNYFYAVQGYKGYKLSEEINPQTCTNKNFKLDFPYPTFQNDILHGFIPKGSFFDFSFFITKKNLNKKYYDEDIHYTAEITHLGSFHFCDSRDVHKYSPCCKTSFQIIVFQQEKQIQINCTDSQNRTMDKFSYNQIRFRGQKQDILLRKTLETLTIID